LDDDDGFGVSEGIPAGGDRQEQGQKQEPGQEKNKAPYYGGLARVTYVAMVMIIV